MKTNVTELYSSCGKSWFFAQSLSSIIFINDAVKRIARRSFVRNDRGKGGGVGRFGCKEIKSRGPPTNTPWQRGAPHPPPAT